MQGSLYEAPCVGRVSSFCSGRNDKRREGREEEATRQGGDMSGKGREGESKSNNRPERQKNIKEKKEGMGECDEERAKRAGATINNDGRSLWSLQSLFRALLEIRSCPASSTDG